MNLNPAQQAALEAFVATLQGTTPLPTTAPSKFWYPTDAQAAALAKRFGWTLHDIYGNRQAMDWPTETRVPPCDGTDADGMLYAAFGFDPTGKRLLWSADNRESAQALCDRIFAAPTPEAANAIIRGAGDPGVTTDCACYLVMTGQTTGGGLLGSMRVGLMGATTVTEAMKAFFRMSDREPGQPGPGIA